MGTTPVIRYLKNPVYSNVKYLIYMISWREAHSSTGRLVTGMAWDGSAATNTKLSITRSFLELQSPDFIGSHGAKWAYFVIFLLITQNIWLY